MKIEGDHTLNASRSLIWQLMNDPETLARISPGVKKLEHVDGDKYRAIFELKVGPVGGTFKGNIETTDKVEPETYTLKVQANSPIGAVSAVGQILLDKQEETRTLVRFSGEAKISGMLARTGQRMMGAVSNKMIGQLFTNLEKEIEKADDQS